MRKKLLFLAFILFIPINCKALSFSINCDKDTINIGDMATCNIINDEEILGNNIEFTQTLSNISVESFSSSYLFNLSGDNTIKGTINNTIPQNSKILSFKLKGLNIGSGKLTFSNIKINHDDNITSINNIEKSFTIKNKSSNNNLNSITIDNIDFKFNKSITSYNLETNQSEIKISAESEDVNSTISGIGTKQLDYGENIINVICTSEAGNVKKYILKITRLDNRNTDNTLKTLSLSNIDLSFKSGVTTYSIFTKESSTEIKATANNSKATITGTGKVNLKDGNNIINIIVTAENGSQKKYVVSINKVNTSDSNNYLSGIVLSSGNLSFDKKTLEYYINVPYNTKSIKIDAKTEKETSKIDYNKEHDLKVGENKVEIKVTSEKGDIRKYILYITRLEEDKELEDLSTNSYLKSLSIKGYEINFDKNKYSYNIKVDKNTNKLDINFITEDKKSSVKINNNDNIENGSIIEITVYSESGVYSTYKINIEKDKDIEKKKFNTLFIVIPIGLIIITIGTLLIIKKRKNS